MPYPHARGAIEQAADETTARPKFSRRPASFSSTAPRSAEPAPASGEAPLALALPPAPAAPSTALALHAPAGLTITRAWQEDARFGMVMLGLVVVLNLTLAYALSLLPHQQPEHPTGLVQTNAKAPTMPEAVSRPGSGVVLYAQPESERRTPHFFNLHHQNAGSTLSTSSEDMPVPTARALDDDAQ